MILDRIIYGLCSRAWKNGFKIGYVEARMEYKVPSTLYSAQVYWSDLDQCFIARTYEYGPTVSAHGPTQAAAVCELQTAIGLVRDIDHERGRPAPDIITLETVDCARDKP